MNLNQLRPNDSDLVYDAYTRWERGENLVNLLWVPAICGVLDICPAYLLGMQSEKRIETVGLPAALGLSEEAIEKLMERHKSYMAERRRYGDRGLKPPDDVDRFGNIEELVYKWLPVEAGAEEYVDEAIAEGKIDKTDRFFAIQEIMNKQEIKDKTNSLHVDSPAEDFILSHDVLNRLLCMEDFSCLVRILSWCLPWNRRHKMPKEDQNLLRSRGLRNGLPKSDADFYRMNAVYYINEIFDRFMEEGRNSG